MNGLEQIRSINATAAAQAQDKARQAKGQKPKDSFGESLRKARATYNPVVTRHSHINTPE